VQVSATSKADAQIEATTLRKQGFPSWVAPNEKNPDLFSVLVGPYSDKADLAKAKASLENLGFRKAFRKEYK
jgi:cell division septation protein DedD